MPSSFYYFLLSNYYLNVRIIFTRYCPTLPWFKCYYVNAHTPVNHDPIGRDYSSIWTWLRKTCADSIESIGARPNSQIPCGLCLNSALWNWRSGRQRRKSMVFARRWVRVARWASAGQRLFASGLPKSILHASQIAILELHCTSSRLICANCPQNSFLVFCQFFSLPYLICLELSRQMAFPAQFKASSGIKAAIIVTLKLKF